MTDYDEIRTCCIGKGICRRCWGFISIAVKVLDNALREQFGFQHLLWVYSGRRGIHCWVSDFEAMQLTDDQRKAIMGWLEVIKGGKDMTKKVNVRLNNRALHPSLQYVFLLVRSTCTNEQLFYFRTAIQISRKEFPNLILKDQDCFASEEQTSVLLELLGDKDVSSKLKKKWLDDSKPSEEKWADVRRELTLKGKESSENKENSTVRKLSFV